MPALTDAESPSVIQIRTQDVTPTHLEKAVIEVLRSNESVLDESPDCDR
jgi:predicted nuclease of predicted toxin-antitoxin system